jgi:hypothetical protein
VVNPTSQRQSRPHNQPSDHPMIAPSVPERALAWVRAFDDTNTRARPNVEQFDLSHNVNPRTAPRACHRSPVRRCVGLFPRHSGRRVVLMLDSKSISPGVAFRLWSSRGCLEGTSTSSSRRAPGRGERSARNRGGDATDGSGVAFCEPCSWGACELHALRKNEPRRSAVLYRLRRTPARAVSGLRR